MVDNVQPLIQDSSSSSDSDDSSKKSVKKVGHMRAFFNRLASKLAYVDTKLLLLSFTYGAGLALLIAFFLLAGPLILSYLSSGLIYFLSFFLPANWLKSTAQIVEEALARYSADKVGVADYALEYAGGSVICSSDTYFMKEGALYTVFGIPLWYHSSNPRAVIQPDVQPGQCWAMAGSSGYVTIQLAMPIVVKEISLEHIPSELATSGLASAPKDFIIEGKEIDMSSPPIFLGQFRYSTASKQSIQMFPIQDSQCLEESLDLLKYRCEPNKRIFSIITLKILSNYGNSDYTCIYRLRVHGHGMRFDGYQ